MATQIKPQSHEAFFKPARTFPKRDARNFPIGPRTERRQKENRDLNKLNIRECELKIKGICIRTIGLSWAHSKKSRFLVTKADWQEAAKSCAACHQAAEAMSHKEMHRIITAAIKRRK